MFPNREEEPVERFGGGQVKGRKRAKTKREWKKGGGRVGSSRSNRFGHANATPLFDFNQVLNTSIVAHLRYSHHHRGSASLLSQIFLPSSFSVISSCGSLVWRLETERTESLLAKFRVTLCVSRVRVKDQEDEETLDDRCAQRRSLRIRGTDRDSRSKEQNVKEDSDIFFYGRVVKEQILSRPEKLVIKMLLSYLSE